MLEVSKRISLVRLILGAHFFLLSFFTCSQSITKKAEELDKLLSHTVDSLSKNDMYQAINTARYVYTESNVLEIDSLKAHSLRVIGRVFSKNGEYDSAEAYFDKAKAIYEKIAHDMNSAIMDMELGIVSRLKGDYGQALQHYAKAEATFKKYDSKIRLGELYRSIAIIKSREHKLTEALTYYFLSEDYAEQLGYYSELAAIQNGISTIYSQQERYDKTLEYLKKSLVTYKRINNQLGISLTYANLGDYFLRTKMYDSVIFYSDLSIAIRPKNSHYNRGVAISKYNKGLAYREKNMLDSAISSFQQSEYMFGRAGDLKTVIYPKTAMIELYRQVGNFDEALSVAEGILKEAVRNQPRGALKDLHLSLSEIYQAKGNFQEALFHKNAHMVLKDSLLDEQKSRQLLEMETKYETEKKEQQISNLEQEKVIASLRIRQQNALLIGGAGLSIILALVGYVIHRNRTLRLAQQRLIVEQQLLRSQMNPHFLFNALGAIHSYIFKGEKREAAEYLSSFGELTRAILDQSSQEWITLKKEIQTLEKYIEIQKLRFPQIVSNIHIEEGLDEEALLIPPILLQPFVENSFEHGLKDKETGKLEVLVKAINGNRLQLEIVDNGRGLEYSTGNHDSKAIQIAKDRLILLYGDSKFKLEVKNRENSNGVLVSIVLPIREAL